MTRPCPVCGPLGTRKDGYTLGHTATCTPGLRALVRAAMAWNRQDGPERFRIHEQMLSGAVVRFRREREATKPKRQGR